jgi:hypothetical protein
MVQSLQSYFVDRIRVKSIWSNSLIFYYNCTILKNSHWVPQFTSHINIWFECKSKMYQSLLCCKKNQTVTNIIILFEAQLKLRCFMMLHNYTGEPHRVSFPCEDKNWLVYYTPYWRTISKNKPLQML